MANTETDRSFFLDYADHYSPIADKQSELSRSTHEKGLQKLTTEE